MTETELPDDETSSIDEATDERTDRVPPETCHETVDPETRAAVLDEYSHRCQVCGRSGPEKGGLATLHVHHAERNPTGMDEHDMDNLTLLCRSCHSWFHQQSTPDDAPVEITDEDQSVLLPQDIEILRYLSGHGPARTGDIVSGVPTDLSGSSVRERLWVLMGLDNLVEDRDRQIVDKGIDTGEWGLVEQIENSARGHIPSDPQLLLQRMEDEQVRQALDRGCDRTDVMDVFDVSRRTTFHKEKRACAYDFPLDAFDRGGRPTNDERSKQRSDTPETSVEEPEEQQRLDAVAEQDQDALGQAQPRGSGSTEATDNTPPLGGDEDLDRRSRDESADTDALRAQLQQAVDALQEVSEAL